MGKKNSSHTRVEPVFDALMDKDPTGGSWLPQLLQMGSRSTGRTGNLAAGSLESGHPRWWGKKERRLDPPKTLLQWLVRNAKAPSSKVLWGSAGTKEKREHLVAGDPVTVAEALRLLEGSHTPRAWYVLEGQSQPDACFVTESYILVIEGKRTEREATASTTWMPQRSQMLRHMDAAMEVRDGRKVLGLMITEGRGGAEATAPSEYWLRQGDLQVQADTLNESLPHRSPAERQEIADGFLGVTTWQRVCADLGLPWPPVDDAESPRSQGKRVGKLKYLGIH